MSRIIKGSNPPTTKTYPQTLYWAHPILALVERVEIVRNCGWHSGRHITADGKPVRDDDLFETAQEALDVARKALDDAWKELDIKIENFKKSESLVQGESS